MPAVCIRCPVSKRLVGFSECLDCAANYQGQVDPESGERRMCRYRYPYLAYNIRQQEGRKDAGISATMLNGCLRQSWWNIHRDYELDPDKLMAATGGTGWHDLMDRYPDPNMIGEQRLLHTLPSGRKITGKFDRLIPVPRAHRTQPDGVPEWWIEDYKRKKEGKVFKEPPAHNALQLNIYRMMIEQGSTNMETGEILSGKVTRLTLLPSAHEDPGYPVAVRLLEIEKVTRYVEHCLDLWEQATPATPPANNTEPTRSYFCANYCPHYEPCRRLNTSPYDPTTLLF